MAVPSNLRLRLKMSIQKESPVPPFSLFCAHFQGWQEDCSFIPPEEPIPAADQEGQETKGGGARWNIWNVW